MNECVYECKQFIVFLPALVVTMLPALGVSEFAVQQLSIFSLSIFLPVSISVLSVFQSIRFLPVSISACHWAICLKIEFRIVWFRIFNNSVFLSVSISTRQYFCLLGNLFENRSLVSVNMDFQ